MLLLRRTADKSHSSRRLSTMCFCDIRIFTVCACNEIPCFFVFEAISLKILPVESSGMLNVVEDEEVRRQGSLL